MANMFGMLPHEVLERANTYDLMVVDVLASYDEYDRIKKQGTNASPEDLEKIYAAEDLQQLVDITREHGK
jgi:ribosome maturation protein Sdo1